MLKKTNKSFKKKKQRKALKSFEKEEEKEKNALKKKHPSGPRKGHPPTCLSVIV